MFQDLGRGVDGIAPGGSTLTMLPTILLFAFMQRTFIRGITGSGIK